MKHAFSIQKPKVKAQGHITWFLSNGPQFENKKIQKAKHLQHAPPTCMCDSDSARLL